MAEENTALSAKSVALKLFSGPADALPKARRLLELIADDDFEGALAHNASVAMEIPNATAIEDWFLNRFEEWDELALVKAKEDWVKAREQRLAKPKPMVWHNGRPYPADVWEEHQRKKAASEGASFFGPGTQPTEEQKQKSNREEKADEPIKAGLPAIVPAQPPPATAMLGRSATAQQNGTPRSTTGAKRKKRNNRTRFERWRLAWRCGGFEWKVEGVEPTFSFGFQKV